MKNWFEKKVDEITTEVYPSAKMLPISKNIEENVIYFKQRFGNSFDILYKYCEINGKKAVFIMDDGMCNNILVTQQILQPIFNAENLPDNEKSMVEYIRDNVVAGIDQSETYDLNEAVKNVISGLVILFVDGIDFCECFGVQGFPKRGIEAPQTEVNERGSHEGFIESFKDNVALLRRRIRSPELKCETLEIGNTSQTRVCVCYLSDRAKPELVSKVKDKISKIDFDMVLGTGYLIPILDEHNKSFFSGIGTTERPDIACAKMAEGRIIVIIDGTPFALIVPYLFIENFQTMDDYIYRPFYAIFIRLLKYVAFFISVFLPGIFVALLTFHQEVLPSTMLYDIAIQESITPFPVMAETIFIHFVYEIVREAGIRMPKAVGGAVSIVGGLVIGDAAVSAGLIAAPMLIIVALSAITSFVVSQIYQPVALLRFLFMFIGGLFGYYGIILGFCAILISMCAISPFGVPFLSPLSPFEAGGMRDSIVRISWKWLGKRDLKIQKMEK